MGTIRDLVQSADWKTEKHVPVIEVNQTVKKGSEINLTVTVGKEIPHPNTSEHYIGFIAVHFLPKGEKFSYLLGRTELSCHGASIQGPNTSTVFTQPKLSLVFKTEKSGVIFVTAYCNIHGLWESSKEINVE